MDKKNDSKLIKRVYVQEFDNRLGPESTLISDEMKKRGLEVISYTAEELLLFGGLDLTKTDLLVGDFDCTHKAMKVLNISIPDAPDYPECLKHLLNRKIWKTTLGKIGFELDLKKENVFIKPSIHTKLFSGLVLNEDWLSYLLSEYDINEEIYCSEIVDFLSEYRVYVVNGEIRSICHYEKDKNLKLDMEVVKEAINLFSKEGYNGKIINGYGIDFGIIKIEEKYLTTLIEINDGISIGAYEGVTSKDYTDMLVARWEQLLIINS